MPTRASGAEGLNLDLRLTPYPANPPVSQPPDLCTEAGVPVLVSGELGGKPQDQDPAVNVNAVISSPFVSQVAVERAGGWEWGVGPGPVSIFALLGFSLSPWTNCLPLWS